ncbi:YicC family protein [Aneurinibacillus sp. Ricciae_BoGa-3]|uniref:YicC/YloC family endoribonuclease n=1 Tax=Aneurinibacillus sp. Ricciae_BoGa-3 TaxID=3022697 RepID=UPI002340AF6E|nr:YicC/YloC family endoribonuclease [Aneurinibacillus sp. Ricciae_BoGa-3]WCK53043.1 YicC family protein [Aneurinibacillus sp. Ricciae_BoGa-3]
MVYSMTGFGRAERRSGQAHFFVEMRSVNHRFNEISIRLPRELNVLEDSVRKAVQEKVKRGRVDILIVMKAENPSVTLEVNWKLARQYQEVARRMSEMLNRPDEITVQQIMALPDVVRVGEEQIDPNKYRAPLMEAVEEAISLLVSMRKKEGQALREDILRRIGFMQQLVTAIEQLAPQVIDGYRERIRARIEEYIQEQVQIDEMRLLNEVALFAERADISEELTRLKSHFLQFFQIVEEPDSIGRKLDFLVQECHREINTMGAKANHLDISQKVVMLKAELEKVKEQVQNIE